MTERRGYYVTTLSLADNSRFEVYEADLLGPDGGIGFPNRVFQVAHDAMRNRLAQVVEEHAMKAQRVAGGVT